jgi:hypothetical protein
MTRQEVLYRIHLLIHHMKLCGTDAIVLYTFVTDINPTDPPTPHIRLATKLPLHDTALYSACNYFIDYLR